MVLMMPFFENSNKKGPLTLPTFFLLNGIVMKILMGTSTPLGYARPFEPLISQTKVRYT